MQLKINTIGLLAAACLTVLLFARPCPALEDAAFVAQVKADTQWLSDYGTRQVGTPEHAQLQEDLLAKLRSIPNVRLWTQEFPMIVPVHEETVLEIAGPVLPGRHAIFPVWPDVVRLNTTGPDGIRGKLVYVEDADFERLPAVGLRDNIAVMEMSAYAQYRRVFDYGAAAVIFIESSQAGRPLPSKQSLYKPRYYVKAGPLADALRAGSVAEARIECRGQWKTVTARNLYAGVKPTDGTGVKPYAVAAAYDSMSRVVGVAPGADMALDCATVLNLLRKEAASPTRPLVFGFLDAYHINQRGMREMAAMLTVTPDGRTRKVYAEIEEKDLEEYRAAAEELSRFKNADEGLAALHDRNAAEHIRRLFKDAVGPELLRLKEVEGNARLGSLRADSENSPDLQARMLADLEKGARLILEHHRDELTPEERAEMEGALAFVAADREVPVPEGAAWSGFAEARKRSAGMLAAVSRPLSVRNRILEATISDKLEIDPAYLPVAYMLWARMVARVEGQFAEQERRIAFFEPMDRLRQEIATHFGLGDGSGNEAVCSFMVALDLSDCGVMVGPGTACNYNRQTFDPTFRIFTRALKRAVKRGDLWPEGTPGRNRVNLDAIEGRVGGGGYLGERALITSAAQSFLLPGVTWLTDDAPRQRIDSPLDRYDRLDWQRIEPQFPGTLDFLAWVFSTDDFISAPKLVSETSAKWRNGMGRVVDISAGETVPRVPRPGLLATLVGYGEDRDGIRRHEFVRTGDDGGFRVPLMCADVFNLHFPFNLEAFNLDAYGAITEALTTTESLVTTRLATTFNLNNKPGEQLPRAVTFACAELNGPSFFDARFLEPLTQSLLQDTVRGGAPKRAHFSIDPSGQMWGLVDPSIRWQLVLRAGAARTRMALLNTVPDGRERGLTLQETFQRGYALDEALPSIPAHISAQDISVLNAWRLEDFRSAGIESEKVDSIRRATGKALEQAAAAMQQDDGAALQRTAVQALANEIRAYQAVKDMGLDIARGAIFLMLMLVPFCVAMERLLFACARIGTQIAASVGIFTVMTALLWSFHPAFRISAQPLVIVMAFTILALSLMVIAMVLRRFQSSVQEFQSSLAEGSGAKMGRGGLLGSAIFLGIANMRKRKVRTLLTGTTIVLVTFALLCFSSASSYVDKKDFRLEGVQAPHPAVLVRRPSFGPLSWNAVPALRNQLAGHDVAIGERVWLGGALGATDWRMFLLNPETGAQVGVRGALGLPPIENQLSGVDRILTNWKTFAEEGGCYLSQDTAQQLGVVEGDPIVVHGRDLVVRGVFDPIHLEDDVTLLDGQRITPYDYAQQEQDWVNRDSQDAIEQETGSAAAMQPTGGDDGQYIPARELVVLPADLVRDVGGSLRSFGIACNTSEQAAAVANYLMQTLVFPAYYSNASGGVNVVVATPLIAVPPKNLAIPLVIAALIIFTTMLNSVSERKGEIYVYTSLGLAPTHVGALFIAEAMTYGLMGAVFGYVAGQGTASVLTSLGLMEGVTLNYSGTAVIKTMLLVQGVVVLSAIVPAITAGKVASPSRDMDWKVPEPVGGVIRDALPFTVSPAAAPGLVAFIQDYLEAHRDGVLGAFDVDTVRLLPPGAGDGIAGLETRLWLAPFDMGVRQTMRLMVNNPDDGACAISVEITHEAGTPKMWWRLNKPFFFDLRRQLLGWRKLSPERILKYIRNAETGIPEAANNQLPNT